MARVIDRVMENPALSAGLFVMALTVAAVVSNAMFLQKVRHPEPWFMTRPAVREAPAQEIPDPRPRAEIALPEEAPPVAERLVPDPTPAPPSPVPERVVITELQRKLADRGLYTGKVDGISGSRTRAAIIAYEEAQGLPVTGEPSLDILDHMNTASIRSSPELPQAEPLPAQPVKAVASAPLEPSEATDRPSARDAIASDPVASEIEIATRNRYLAVQQALNRIGYGPVAEDGNPGDSIENAIRRFELDNGLPITGAPDEEVIDRLVAIGAMDVI